jgi:hypothetical protein
LIPPLEGEGGTERSEEPGGVLSPTCNSPTRPASAGHPHEQQQRAIEIAGTAEAAHRDVALHGGTRLAFEVGVIDLGHEPAGRDGVDAHALEGQFERQGLGRLHHRRLGHRVGGDALGDAETEHRGDVDD